MSEKKPAPKVQAKPLKQFITDNDISWVRNGQQADINKITGDEQYAAKAAHSARRFKQNMVYAARRTNVNTHKKHFQEELNYHASKSGWWNVDYDGLLIKNIDKEYHYIR